MKQTINLDLVGEDAVFHHAGFAVKSIDELVKPAKKNNGPASKCERQFIKY